MAPTQTEVLKKCGSTFGQTVVKGIMCNWRFGSFLRFRVKLKLSGTEYKCHPRIPAHVSESHLFESFQTKIMASKSGALNEVTVCLYSTNFEWMDIWVVGSRSLGSRCRVQRLRSGMFRFRSFRTAWRLSCHHLCNPRRCLF